MVNERVFFMTCVNTDGSFRGARGPFDLYALERELEAWRSDKRNESLIALVVESYRDFTEKVQIDNIQVYEKPQADVVSDDAIVWSFER